MRDTLGIEIRMRSAFPISTFRQGELSIKIAAVMAAMALLAGMSTVAKAQSDGNPFKYTINGNFIDGEPDATYNAVGGKAYVSIGVAAVYTVTNMDTRTRHARTRYNASGSLAPAMGGANVIPAPPPAAQGAHGNDEGDLLQGQTKTYGLNFMASGNVNIGTYSALALFDISDDKTTDILGTQANKTVTVN